MGRQVGFYVDKYDHFELLRFAEQKDFRAVPLLIENGIMPKAWPPSRYPEEAPAPESLHPSFSPEVPFYLLPPGFPITDTFYDGLPDTPGFACLRTSLAVIEFWPRHVRDDTIARARIYYGSDRSAPRYDEGVKGYNLLARYIRKWPKTTNTKWAFYIGPHVAEACRRGDVQLIDGKKILEIAWPRKASASHERRG